MLARGPARNAYLRELRSPGIFNIRLHLSFVHIRNIFGISLLATLSIAAVFSARHTLSQVAVNRAQRSARTRPALEKREAAYRANNIGVALLEQYKAKEAAEEFRRALSIDPQLRLARINLAIALYFLPSPAEAKEQAENALVTEHAAPQPHYILGLIARGQNHFDEAIAEFRIVLGIDPDDLGANVNLGQILVQQKRYPEAIAAFRKAIEAEPYNETALYNLGLLLTRTGARDEGRRLMQRFEKFRQLGAGTTLGTTYLESGRYAEAIASTGAEAELVDRVTPQVSFTDATADFLPAAKSKTLVKNTASSPTNAAAESPSAADAIVLFDYDGDGDLDIFDPGGSQRLLQNDFGKFTDVTAGSGLSLSGNRGGCLAAIAGDYDNDGKPDLFVVRTNPTAFLLYHNDGNGRFSDRSASSGLSAIHFQSGQYTAAAFVDVDHDGDLDLLIGGPTNILLRNNGNGTFSEISQAAGLSTTRANTTAIVATDFNNKRDVDLFLQGAPPLLLSNMRDGTFRDVTKEARLNPAGRFSCVAAGDFNKDGYTDFFLGGESPGLLALSDGHNHFKLMAAPGETRGAVAAQFLDYDNDGLLDLVLVTARGLLLFRNVGNSLADVSKAAFSGSLQRLIYPGQSTVRTALAAADLDGDGDIDLILRGRDGELRILRNDGGNRNNSITIDLHGRVSNKSAVEATVELRAGSLWQKLEMFSAWPAPAPADLVFGLGQRTGPDAVRVLWPAGIVQSETEFPATTQQTARRSFEITELDRKPSSCPYLYAWNGKRFEFVTDFMGGGEMGYLERPGEYNQPDPVETVRIPDDKLKEKEGRYELRVTDELEEAMFVDQLQLLAVAHPDGTAVYPNEGMSDPPKPFRLFVTRDARPPLSAVDDQGHDVLDLISRIDRRWPDDFHKDRIRGYGEEHSLTMKLSEPASAKPSPSTKGSSARTLHPVNAKPDNQRILLLLTGWTDYAWSSDNVAAAQAGKLMKPPSLQVKDQSGHWRTVITDIGIPVGRPQTVTVDLTHAFLSDDRHVRIITNMRIYWDQVLVDTSASQAPAEIIRLNPIKADLHWRGFSNEITPDGHEPFGYDYRNVLLSAPWKAMPGRYTREGDVRELLLRSDDIFVICRPGDEISLSFDAASLPPLPSGWTRSFLLYSDGFSKEMDINSASPDQLEPLPFHKMSRYPYRWPEHYPSDTQHREYLERYNTRIIGREVPSIDAEIVNRQ